MKTINLNNWIKKQKKISDMVVSKVDINDTNGWILNSKKIYNKKKNFFSILPFSFNINKKKFWNQPLIVQKEVGILGILKKRYKSTDYYLLQAKIEPGNTDNIQLSPTVQATKSNYLRKHGGKKTKFLEYFVKKKPKAKIISNLKLSEQGTRYVGKHNKNILIDVNKIKLQKYSNFIWLTKKNLIYLLNKRNLLNMDTISVLSSSIKQNKLDNPLNSLNIILKQFNIFKKKFIISKKQIYFNKLKNWKIKKDRIFDLKNNFFSILFIKIKTNSREIESWHQPIISDHSKSFNGFLVKVQNNTVHYLLQITQEPGFNSPKFTTTVNVKNFNFKKNRNIKYMNHFKKNNFKLDVINSDEGGRFFKNESRNIICVLKKQININSSKNYIWASHNQVINLINQNKLSIEARNLFASFNIDKIN